MYSMVTIVKNTIDMHNSVGIDWGSRAVGLAEEGEWGKMGTTVIE